ncbi:MAG: hypothetical protein JXQ93_10805 [Flavobacteriaceae bacterium]
MKKQKAEYIVKPVIEEYTIRVDSITKSIDTIIDNFTGLVTQLEGTANMLSGHIEKSASSLEKMYDDAQKDLTNKINKHTGLIRKVYKDLEKDLIALRSSITFNIDSYKLRVQEMISKVKRTIAEFKKLSAEIQKFLKPMHDALSTIVDAVDFLLPGDISLPEIPSFPKFPELGIKKLIDDIRADFTNLKNDIGKKVEKHKAAIVNQAKAVKRDLNSQVAIYTGAISTVIDESLTLEAPEFLEVQYWRKNYLNPGTNIYLQVNEMTFLASKTYDELKEDVFTNNLGKTYNDIARNNRKTLRFLIYMIGVWGLIIFISYLMSFYQNIKFAVHIIMGKEVSNKLIL